MPEVNEGDYVMLVEDDDNPSDVQRPWWIQWIIDDLTKHGDQDLLDMFQKESDG